MNYYEQMLLSLKPQRKSAARMRDVQVITFFLVDVLWMGFMFALAEMWQASLWLTFALSAISFGLIGSHLWWAAYYDRVVNDIEDTMAVTARNLEGT